MHRKVVACGLLTLMLAACSSDDEPKPTGGVFAGSGGGTSGTGGASGGGASGSGGSAGDSGGGGTSPDAGDADVDAPDADGKDAVADVVTDVDLDVVLPLTACPNATSAVGTQQLQAGGATPTAFATAYNAELASMSEPGPMVLEFNGLDVVDATGPAAWNLRFGAAEASGSTVSFLGTPAEIPFEFATNRNVIVSFTEADFSLHFDTATSQVDIPAVSIMTAGEFDDQCSTLLLEGLDVVIPATAGTLSFHGSTLADLLGDPDYDCCGGTKNAWMVMLSGILQPVQVQ